MLRPRHVWMITPTMLAATVAFGQFCQDPVEPYYEEFQINQQVDPVRHVERAVMLNDSSGDYILEFIADRTDAPGVREHWTARMIFCDETTDFVYRVEVDREWQFSASHAGHEGNPRLSLAVPETSAEIDVRDPCNSAEFERYRSIAIQIASVEAVVGAVLAEIPGPRHDPNCWHQCQNWPAVCDDPGDDCEIQYMCCI